MPVLIDHARLDRIDWDFPQTGNLRGSVHALHWFPGNFIAQIPAALIQVLSAPGDVVLDPFGGSATTAVEAIRLGRRAIISDRLSPAVLIGRAKLGLLDKPLERHRRGEILASLAFEHQCRSDQLGSNGEGGDPILASWYAPGTLAQLRYLWRLVESEPPEGRQVLAAVFSDVLFDCASTGGAPTRTGKRRRHHWGWIADNVLPKVLVEHNAVALFCERLASVADGEQGSSSHSALLVQQDARCLALADETVDLVVTSPPYVGVIDYTHANRLLYAWMGWSMALERQDEIGARFRRNRRNAVAEYRADMRLVRDEIRRVLRPGAYCAVVIGASRRFPNAVEELVADFAESIPLTWGPRPRSPSRRRVSDRAAQEAVEFVCTFRKE